MNLERGNMIMCKRKEKARGKDGYRFHHLSRASIAALIASVVTLASPKSIFVPGM